MMTRTGLALIHSECDAIGAPRDVDTLTDDQWRRIAENLAAKLEGTTRALSVGYVRAGTAEREMKALRKAHNETLINGDMK